MPRVTRNQSREVSNFEPSTHDVRRQRWVDYAKGLAIACVVFSHVLQGLLSAKMLAATPGWQFIDCWLYTFQVPVFFFISGVFVKRVEARTSPRKFLQDQLLRIGYPYVLWQTLQILIMLASGGATNRSVSSFDLLKFPLHPMFQFWFLYVLLLILSLYAALRCLNMSDRIIFWLFLSMLFWPEIAYPFNLLRTNAVYFGCGLVAPEALKWMTNWSMAALASCGAGCFAAMTLLVTLGLAYPTPFRPVGALFGILGTTAIAMTLAKRSEVPGLSFIGKYSLEIYLAHVCFTAAVRILLSRVLHVNDVSLQFALAIVAGLLGPCVIGVFANSYKIPTFRLTSWK